MSKRIRLIALVAVAAALTGIITVAFASAENNDHGSVTAASSFSVLSNTTAAKVSGAVLALQQQGVKVYAAQEANGDICVTEENARGAGGQACGHAPEAVSKGLSEVVAGPSLGEPTRITVLVPNGVRSVTFKTTDGSTNAVPVVNNVATESGATLQSATYTLPSGASEVATVSAALPQG